MTLEQISKPRYRKHFNRLMVAVIIAMFALALGVAQLLILLFPNETGSHFVHNISGVITAGLVIASLIYKYRHHPAMYEILYVWNLKQQLNRIYRKQRKILVSVGEGDRDAMVIMNFSYQGSQQLYTLDDNTVTMEELNKSLEELQATIKEHNYDVELDDYRPSLLEKF